MGTVTIGSGKTYSWDVAFPTQTNLQHIGTSTPNSQDGYVILDFISGTKQTWDTTNGWTLSTSGSGKISEINPDGQLHLKSDNTNGVGAAVNLTFGTSNSNRTFAWKFKGDIWSDSTSTISNNGFYFDSEDGTKEGEGTLRKNASNNICIYAPSINKMADTNTPADSNWHLVAMRRNGGTVISVDVDGIYIGDFTPTSYIGIPGDLSHAIAGYGGSPAEEHIDFSYYVENHACYATSGEAVSDQTNAMFDAGEGKVWKKIDINADTGNSTTLTGQSRVAGSSGGLSGASYASFTSGSDLPNKDRWIEIKLDHAGDGDYTSILKDITLTSEDAQSPSKAGLGMMGFF